jgi:hypothetical protein
MKFENQFIAVPAADRLRTTVEMPFAIDAKIKALEPKTGVLQTTISILVTKLINELAASTIKPGERYEYQDAIANLTLRLPERYYPVAVSSPERVTAAKPATGKKRNRTAKAASGNDGCGASGVAQPAA